MNSPKSHPRFLCRWVRLWSSLTGADRPAARHLAQCADCRAFYEASAAFEQRLRRSARHQTAAVPAGLEDRILQAIDLPSATHRPSAAPSRSRAPWLWFSLAGAAAAAAVTVSVMWFQPTEPHDTEIATTTPPNPSTGGIDVVEATLPPPRTPARLWTLFGNSAATWSNENALKQEITSVYSDTRSALRFLALNFLPEDAASALAPDADQSGRT